LGFRGIATTLSNGLPLNRERRMGLFSNQLTAPAPLVGLLGRSNRDDLEVRVGGLDPDDHLMKARNLRNQANLASFVVEDVAPPPPR
jgi:hypothetical protein